MIRNIKRLLELESQLKYHDYMYFEQDQPVISDAQYEELAREYETLKEETPGYTSGYGIGFVAPDPAMELVPILEPMLSISKKKDRASFEKWVKTNLTGSPVYEDKLDGMALRLIYVNGDLARIHTRGAGNNGADLSHRRHLLLNVPDHIESDANKGRTEYTGEAFCKFDDFNNYIERHELNPKETDPRSTVSGLLKRHKTSDRDDLNIYFKVYSASQSVRENFETYIDLREYFTSIGFDVPMLLDGSMLNEMLSLPEKPKNEYPIDGVVVKDNNLRQWDVEQGNQYWSYATCYKFPSVSLETKVVDIDWSLTLRGELVGTLIYEPIEYDGTKLTRAKLDYAQSYFDKGLAIGSIVKITKSNEIIPRLVGLVNPGHGQRLKYPDTCPFCNEMVTLDQEAGAAFCNNDACSGQLLRQLIRLTDRKTGLNIKGLGEKNLQALLDNGFLSNPSDLFNLTEEDLINSGIDILTSGSIINQIANLNELDLHRWLSAMGVPGLGIVRAIEISNFASTNGLNDELRFHDLNALMTIITDGKFLSDMFGLDGLVIGNYIRQNQEEITRFLSHYDFSRTRTPALDGIPVSITGVWASMSHEMLADALAEKGIILTNTVTKTVKMLLVGSKPSPSKIEKAGKWNIPTADITSIYDVNNIVSLISK